MYEKIHVTPDEIKSWGLSGGKSLQTFDTDCAKIGVLICYDVEFPELSRIMADQGMQFTIFSVICVSDGIRFICINDLHAFTPCFI